MKANALHALTKLLTAKYHMLPTYTVESQDMILYNLICCSFGFYRLLPGLTAEFINTMQEVTAPTLEVYLHQTLKSHFLCFMKQKVNISKTKHPKLHRKIIMKLVPYFNGSGPKLVDSRNFKTIKKSWEVFEYWIGYLILLY